ncbi:Hypothetical predicted protein [Mytilus galloprovincialis]|uniref:CCHC-type domain-containing protein n=1 Tax=Mytilus galloprovincialis TaxID=29158 RepID=A0A8B6CK77_MYTGA|nr:Hypothetical predicted protein [Mytilus galloprovincialis]
MDTDMLSSPLRNAISREVSNAISTSQQDLLNSINGIMDSKLTNLQTTLQESQQEISQTQMAKMEETLTDNYTFHRKGNENQFKYGVKVLTKLKEAKSSLEVHDLTRATVQNAKSRISEGIDIVQERQKLIKLADSSQLGWKVVNEYVANPIAEDSEDERKMLRAQSRAERKSKAEKTKKSIKPRQVPYARNADKDDSFKPGKCFNCGKRGHWADNCPDRKQKISNSLYLSNLDSSSLFCSSDDNFYCNNSKIRNANEKVSITIDCLQKVDLVTYVEKPVSPVGRLKNAIDEWRLITGNTHIIDVIQNGFKYEDTKLAREIFHQHDFLYGYDLNSAYHHIEIVELHREYLGFAWEIDGANRYFVFNVLPFGLATAGYIFTKVLREVVKYFRSKGKQIIMFLDDGLGGGKDFESCQKSSQFVKFHLQKLGFLIAHKKCVWDPCQKLKWLGFIWNTETGRIFVSPERIDKAEQTVNYILSEIGRGKVLLKARILAGIVGQLISMQIVFGDLVRLKTRFLYACVNGRASWEASVKITSEAIDELEFWRVSCRARNSKGVNISTVNFHDNFDVDLFCDASDVGFGGFVPFMIVPKYSVTG